MELDYLCLIIFISALFALSLPLLTEVLLKAENHI